MNIENIENITRQFQDFIKSIERWDDLVENQLDLLIKNGADINAKTYELYDEDDFDEDYDEDYFYNEKEPEEYETDENILTFFVRRYAYHNNNYDITIIYYLLTRGAIPEKESIIICCNYNDRDNEILKLIDELLKYSEYSDLIIDNICNNRLSEIDEIFRGYNINLKLCFDYSYYKNNNLIKFMKANVNPLELEVLNYSFDEFPHKYKISCESVIKELKKFYTIDDDKIVNIIQDRCGKKRIFGNEFKYEEIMYRFMSVTCYRSLDNISNKIDL